MSDIVGRLRFAAKDPAGTNTHVAIYRGLCSGGAAEIERLRATIREQADYLGVVNANAGRHEMWGRIKGAVACLDAALSGKGES